MKPQNDSSIQQTGLAMTLACVLAWVLPLMAKLDFPFRLPMVALASVAMMLAVMLAIIVMVQALICWRRGRFSPRVKGWAIGSAMGLVLAGASWFYADSTVGQARSQQGWIRPSQEVAQAVRICP